MRHMKALEVTVLVLTSNGAYPPRINNVIIVGPLVVDLRVYVHYYTKEFYVEL